MNSKKTFPKIEYVLKNEFAREDESAYFRAFSSIFLGSSESGRKAFRRARFRLSQKEFNRIIFKAVLLGS